MMTIDQNKVKKIADILHEASLTRKAIMPVSTSHAPLTINEAYTIQMLNVERGVSEGRNISGKKIGLSNKAIQELLGVDQPDFGHLFADMEVKNGKIEMDTMMQPRAEAEIAFVLSKNLDMNGEITVKDVLESTAYVLPSLEIVDSRIADWKINILDTVSDNASCGKYVLGSKKTGINDFDRFTETMELFVNGESRGSGIGSAVLGDSAYCVAWLANKMREFGTLLKAGDVILPGALSAMVPVVKGDTVKAVFGTLGSVEVKFV